MDGDWRVVEFSGADGPQDESFPPSGLKSTTTARISRNSRVIDGRGGTTQMPNDAKLGLLAGVIGVIAVAVVSASRPAPANLPAPVASAPSVTRTNAAREGPTVVVSTPSARPAEQVSTPIARTRTEPTGTPTSRTPMDDIDP
jgi:hypothetical protein